MELKVDDYAPHEIVKFMRENMGITQSELAKKLNRSANWLKAIEQNV